MSSFCYSMYGFNIESELEIPYLKPVEEGNKSDIIIQSSNESIINDFLFPSYVNSIIRQSGLLAIHGTALCKNGVAIILCSNNDISELVLEFIQNDWKFMADEIVIIEKNDNAYCIRPGIPVIKVLNKYIHKHHLDEYVISIDSTKEEDFSYLNFNHCFYEKNRFISLDTVVREAKQTHISIEEHVAHMVVHGILHLLGYDHMNDNEAKIMENLEIQILKKLGYKNPYKAFNETYVHGSYSRIRNILLYVLFGIMVSLGFAPFNLWMVAIVGFAGVYWLTIKNQNEKSLFKSFCNVIPFGAVYSLGMFWWVVHSIYAVPDLTEEFAVWTVPALLAIALVGGIIFSIPFAVIQYKKIPVYYRPVFFATLITLVLWMREWLCTGFPWNPLSNIWITIPSVSNSMSVWGSLGLTFITAGLIATVVELLISKRKGYFYLFTLFVLLFVIGIWFGYRNIKYSEQIVKDDVPIIRIVQPATSAELKGTHSREAMLKAAEQTIADLYTLTNSASTNKRPDIIVYPETTYPYILTNQDVPLASILDTNVVMGTMGYRNSNLYNTMAIINQNGKVQDVYDKFHLVPFGEYRPFGDLIPTPGQLTPGTGPSILHINTKYGEFNFVPAICYEIIFSDSLIRTKDNIDAIINITNDTWFGKTPGVFQHLDMVRRYAIESGLPVIRADYSGISAFISADGNIVSLLPIAERGILDGFVWGAHNTVYRMIGRNLWMLFILSFSLLVLISIREFQKKD